MWKPEHRRAAERNDLRYTSDLNDAEWALVEAMIPPGRHGGRKRSLNVREVLNGMCCGQAANGRHCPRICRPRARCTLSRTLELGRHAGACSSCALRCGARAGGTG